MYTHKHVYILLHKGVSTFILLSNRFSILEFKKSMCATCKYKHVYICLYMYLNGIVMKCLTISSNSSISIHK